MLGFLPQQAANASLQFTTEASFLAATQPGVYLNDFNSLPIGSLLGSQSYSGGSPLFNYTIASSTAQSTDLPHGLIGVIPAGNGTPAMSVNSSLDDIIVTFTSGNVTAVGGQFFLTDLPGKIEAGNVKVNLSDGSSATFASIPLGFNGFVTSASGPVITSLVVHSDVQVINDGFATVDHFYAGAAVPEPTTMIAGALLLLPFGASTLRMLRKNRAA